MSNSFRRLALAIALLLAVAPALARAQDCGISGPHSFCGPTARLCGPSGSYELIWGGPGIVGYDGSCIIVDTPGDYTLQTIDLMTGVVSAPCVFTLSRGTPPAATITGVTDGCLGDAVTLCGPDGTWSYAWTGPAGFTAATRCIDTSTPGDYTLVVSDDAAGCVSDPATVTVGFHDCTPPAAPTVNCPRTAWWWSATCESGRPGIDAAAMARIAACVDDHAASLSWNGDAAGLCRVLRRHPADLRSRALRQFAAVIANTCAPTAGLGAEAGPVGLDPTTPLTGPDATGTVADWIAATDQRLVALAGRHGHGVRDAYRDVIRQGWAIAHGRGIGPVCPQDSVNAFTGRGLAIAPDDVLAEELSDAGERTFATLDFAQNPARGDVQMSLAIEEPASDVVVGVYDLSGRRVRELAHGTYPAGTFTLSWDGRDASGTRMPNGVYFVQMRIDGVRTQSRLTLLR